MQHITFEKTKDTNYRYFDMNGDEIFAGDYLKDIDSGRVREIYLSEDKRLGVDATNPLWIENGRAVPCEYGLYPLEEDELESMVLCSKEG